MRTRIGEASLVQNDKAAPFGLLTREYLEQPAINRYSIYAVRGIMHANDPEVRAYKHVNSTCATAKAVGVRTLK